MRAIIGDYIGTTIGIHSHSLLSTRQSVLSFQGRVFRSLEMPGESMIANSVQHAVNPTP